MIGPGKDAAVGIGSEITIGQQRRPGLLAHARPIDRNRDAEQTANRQIAQRDVLGNGERRHQPQFLGS